jgi:hypothetical protein
VADEDQIVIVAQVEFLAGALLRTPRPDRPKAPART